MDKEVEKNPRARAVYLFAEALIEKFKRYTSTMSSSDAEMVVRTHRTAIIQQLMDEDKAERG